jgi:hypothetical protein
MVTLVMEGVLPTDRNPATPMHKVQRTMRMFIGVTPDGFRYATLFAASRLPEIPSRCIELKGNSAIG